MYALTGVSWLVSAARSDASTCAGNLGSRSEAERDRSYNESSRVIAPTEKTHPMLNARDPQDPAAPKTSV